MAKTVKNTDKKSLNSVFSRLNPKKIESPVTSDLKSCERPRQTPSSFINYKIEIPNDSLKKRKLDDSSQNDGYSNGKKPRVPASPDLGCFMDYSSPLEKRNPTFTPSNPTLSKNAQACSAERKATGSARLDWETGSSCPKKEEVKTEHSPNTQKILLRLSPAFDYDVDDILCIDPLSHEAKEGSKGAKTDLVVVEDDKGYVSTSNDQQEERPAESLPEPQHQEAFPRDQGSFLNNSLSTSGPQPAKSFLKCLEGDEEELWNIGAPLFESSVCQSSGALEPRRRVSEAGKEPEQSHHGYMAGDSTLETSYEDSLPLKVQVKSKVEIPGRSGGMKAAEEEKAKAKNVTCGRSNIWNNNAEMDRQKRRYVDSVTSHMAENQNTTQGFVSELQNLMTHVSEQTGSHGARWQHPSDLTRRNYQKRFGSETPGMTLSEWQDRNLSAHKRFCKIPKIFERSPFP